MLERLEHLPWLPPAPDDFRRLCKTFAGLDGDASADLRHLASFALTAMQSASLKKAIVKRAEVGDEFAEFNKIKIAVLAAWTTDYLLDCLPAAAARHGIVAGLVTTEYDQIVQETLDPTSAIYSEKADIALLAVDHRWLQLEHPAFADADGGSGRVDHAIAKLRSVVTALRSNGGPPVILQTLATPVSPIFGSFDRSQPGTLRELIAKANIEILQLARETNSYVLDVAALAESVGTARWFDIGQWNGYKIPFAAEFYPLYADWIGRLLGAIYGRSRKCLVLDLDNTMWGGAIGDDGVAGIKIGQGSAIGEAFLSVQQIAHDLKARGVILAVCSKNEDETARLPFREHPDMLLKETDFSAFRANWNDKSANIREIAKQLNIGLDSLVFLDDNPAERAQVRAALPMVAVPEIGNDPTPYAGLLQAAGYFEAVSFSADDQLRTQSYVMDKERASLQQSLGVADYLASLEMMLDIGPVTPANRQRVTQLINKTNQFNLTTRRYTEAEVKTAEESGHFVTVQARLRDKFGDLGLIAVIIAQRVNDGDAADLHIDTWLMSCRVLGRRVEEAMLDYLVGRAKDADVRSIIGRFIPTAKNAMVADMYPRLGFAAADNEGDSSLYRLDVQTHENAGGLPFACAARLGNAA